MTSDATRVSSRTRRGVSRSAIENARLRAFRQARRHSVLVRVLKVTLPALAALATAALFITPSLITHLYHPDINASVGAVEVTTDQLRMVNPRFDGFTADKGHYVVTARAAVQTLGNIDVMNLEAVHGHLVQMDKSWTDITSKAGSYQTKTKALRLSDGIVITTSNAARAELSDADIDVDKKLVTSGAVVVMTMPNGKLKGRGLLVDNAAHRLVLKSEVSAHLVPPKRSANSAAAPAVSAVSGIGGGVGATPALSDAPVDISSAQLEILDTAKTATFTGNVEAVQSGMTLHGDRMEVGYTGSAGANPLASTDTTAAAQNISYVTASSHVVLATLDGRKATCDQSRFDQKANTMTLLGSVVLSQKGSELHADTVIYDMAAKTTHVTAKNRVSGHFEPDATSLAAAKSGSAEAQPASLSGLASGRSATDISADTLDIADGDNQAVFQGTVIVTQRGNKLTGDRLVIDMAKRHMTMDGPGRVSGMFEAAATPARTTHIAQPAAAPGGDAVPGLGHSFTSLASSNGQPTNIEADSMSVEDDRGEATFTGKVLVVRGGHRISAGTLVVNYLGGTSAAGGSSQLSRIRAKDHVVVHTPDNQLATSDWLLYEAARNLLTMGGNVTVSQGDNVIHGEKLIVDLTSGESHFETSAEPGAATAQAAAPSGRIQVLITPQGIRQIGGPPAAGIAPANKPKGAAAMSASDVMVAPDAPQ